MLTYNTLFVCVCVYGSMCACVHIYVCACVCMSMSAHISYMISYRKINEDVRSIIFFDSSVIFG